MEELNDQRLQRIKKLDTLRALGIQPHGSRFEIKDRADQLVRLHAEKTKDTLEYHGPANELVSRRAGLAFPIRDGIPIMLLDSARPLD